MNLINILFQCYLLGLDFLCYIFLCHIHIFVSFFIFRPFACHIIETLIAYTDDKLSA